MTSASGRSVGEVVEHSIERRNVMSSLHYDATATKLTVSNSKPNFLTLGKKAVVPYRRLLHRGKSS